MKRSSGTSKAFYDAQYADGHYAAYASPTGHSFLPQLEMLISKHGDGKKKWLEVGCGRGLLQDVVEEYTGVDIAETVSVFMHKPFRCAPAESLPFPDGSFDGIWSYAVLEHVEEPGKALEEMRRVLKSRGILLLAPAWQCRSWPSRDFAWKPYAELAWPDRIRKASIPIRNSMVFRAATLIPARLWRFVLYSVCRSPTRFRSRPLQPNYAHYKVVDADARHSMDPFEAILWFRSRGDRVLSHPGWWRALSVRTGSLVVEVGKA